MMVFASVAFFFLCRLIRVVVADDMACLVEATERLYEGSPATDSKNGSNSVIDLGAKSLSALTRENQQWTF